MPPAGDMMPTHQCVVAAEVADPLGFEAAMFVPTKQQSVRHPEPPPAR
jgi:hypothetical protein